MRGAACGRAVLLTFGIGLLAWTSEGPAQTARVPAKVAPKLEAVAETKLLMEGLNQSNFRGLDRLLKDKPADVESWKFIRGQALLIAETGNLLMLRPPKTKTGQDAWMEYATDLRAAATSLARMAAARDYDRSKAALGSVANVCNRCHRAFRVEVKVATGERETE